NTSSKIHGARQPVQRMYASPVPPFEIVLPAFEFDSTPPQPPPPDSIFRLSKTVAVLPFIAIWRLGLVTDKRQPSGPTRNLQDSRRRCVSTWTLDASCRLWNSKPGPPRFGRE